MENIAFLLSEAWQVLDTTTQTSGKTQLATCLGTLPSTQSSLENFMIMLTAERERETSKSVEKIPSKLPKATAQMNYQNE